MVNYKDLDEKSRSLVLEIFCVKKLLEWSVISDTYIADPAIVQALAFTSVGEHEIKNVVKRNPKLDPTTVRLLVFLEFESSEGIFIDHTQTNVTALRNALSESIKSKRIMYPWTYGRETVDLLVELFDVTPDLNSKNTTSLLKKGEVGVFQVGHSVVGPFGCLESPTFREIKPVLELRGFIEVRDSERIRRNFRLSTGEGAKINVARRSDDKLKLKLGLGSKATSPNLLGVYRSYLKENIKPLHLSDQILLLLGETLSLEEAKSVLENVLPYVFRRQGGSKLLGKQTGMILGDTTKFVASLSRQQIQQLFHLATNEELFWALENSIDQGQIEFVADFSRFSRKPKNNVRLELSRLGVRNDNGEADGLYASNIVDLLYQIYVFSGQKTEEDLRYILDSQETDLDLLVRNLVSAWDPARIIDYLAGERNLGIFSAKYLGIESPETLTIKELKLRIGYKLGLRYNAQNSLLDNLELQLTELEKIPLHDTRAILNSFRQVYDDVETALKDILVFSWWALVKERGREAADFTYNHVSARNEDGYVKYFSGSEKDASKPTLSKLSGAFNLLVTELKTLDKTAFETDFSSTLAEAQSRPIVLRFKEMYHNLNPSSQRRVLSALERLGKIVLEMTTVRNPASHGNREEDPSSADVQITITLTSEVILIARETGLFPELWDFTKTELLDSGFVYTEYNCGARSLSLHSPTRALAHGLPKVGKRLYFLPGCELEHVGPLRFKLKNVSPISDYWANFPPELEAESSFATLTRLPSENLDSEVA